jgi:hypothetical protein
MNLLIKKYLSYLLQERFSSVNLLLIANVLDLKFEGIKL